MSIVENKNTPNYLALFIGIGIVIVMIYASINNLFEGNITGAIFQFLFASVFAYFSYREIKYGSIEPKESTEE